MQIINRAVITVRPNQTFLDWINRSDPAGKTLTLDDINDEPNTYLIPEIEEPSDIERYLQSEYLEIFEHTLEGWYTDETLWPKDRSYQTFRKWCDIEWSSIVFDLGREKVVWDEE